MPKNRFYEPQDEDDEVLPSRSQIKREAIAFQKLGERIVNLSNKNLSKITLWGELEDAILLARRLPNKDAKRRQIRLIGKLLRTGEHEAITQALERIDSEASLQNHRFHALEKLRDDLFAGNDQTIQSTIEKYNTADRNTLRQLVRGARKEVSQGQTPKNSRKLFTYLRELDQEL